jgi:hypothetical protein
MVKYEQKAEYVKGIRLSIKVPCKYLLGITKSIHHP